MSGSGLNRFSSFWRRAGMNYLEMITVASTSLRSCLKEPMRTEALGRTTFSFREFKFEDGHEMPAGESTARAASRDLAVV